MQTYLTCQISFYFQLKKITKNTTWMYEKFHLKIEHKVTIVIKQT